MFCDLIVSFLTDCPSVPLTDVIAPSACSCMTSPDYGAICKENGVTDITFSRLYLLTSIRVTLDGPLGGAPTDVTVHYLDPDAVWTQVDYADITIGGPIIYIIFTRHLRTTSLRVSMTTTKPSWCGRISTLNGCKADGRL